MDYEIQVIREFFSLFKLFSKENSFDPDPVIRD